MRFVARVLMMAIVALPAVAQDWRGGQGRLEGKVVDASNQPIEGASVKLQLGSRGGPTIKTDKKGHWAVLGLVAGEWAIDIEASGYSVKRITMSLANETARIPLVEVKLEKTAPTGPPPEVLGALANADKAYDAGRYAEARSEYEKALADQKIAAQPAAANALHLRIARCLSAEGKYDQELVHLQAVLEASPGDPIILNLMAQEALKGGETDKGLELLGKLPPDTLKDADTLFNIGVLLINANKPEPAVEYFTKAVTVDAGYADGYFQRALVYLQLQKFAESRADLKKFLELQPESPKAETARKALTQLPK
jgi:hypothetical protein